MIVVTKNKSSKTRVDALLEESSFGERAIALGDDFVWVFKNENASLEKAFLNIPDVNVFHNSEDEFRLTSKGWKENTLITLDDQHTIGKQDELMIVAGPCAVETEEQMDIIASSLHEKGVKYLRGGAYKPRTSPYAFQGLGENGLKILRDCGRKYNMKTVTEVLDLSLLDEVASYADVLQIGTRNMFNYQFLKELGRTNKPVILKRGFSATIKEWLLAAEYILLSGNPNVILCERGIRTFETALRNTLDVGAIALVKELSHLPVIADPSQGTGKASLVPALAKSAVAAGADGLIVEVHHDPAHAWSDGFQSLDLHSFDKMLGEVNKLAFSLGKKADIDKLQIN